MQCCPQVFYQLKSPDCSLPSVLSSCGVFQKEMALSACGALTPHLSVLTASGINTLSLRISTQADMVGKRAKQWLSVWNMYKFSTNKVFFAPAGGVPGRLRRPATPPALHERAGQRPDPRHPRRRRQCPTDCHGHGVHFLHHTRHLTSAVAHFGTQPNKQTRMEKEKVAQRKPPLPPPPSGTKH